MPTAKCPRCGQALRLADGAKSFRCPVCSAAITIRPRPQRLPATAPPTIDDAPVVAELAAPGRRAQDKRSPWPWIIIGAVLLMFIAVPAGFLIAISVEPSTKKPQAERPASGQLVGFVGGLIFVGVFYFLPGLIAGYREHHNALAIFMLNLLLGWTFLGWCVAMVWACTEVRQRP